jgi:hypothetical protein
VSLFNFIVSMASFTAGISVVAFAIAAARRFAGGGTDAARAVRGLQEEVELLRGDVDRLRTDVERASRPPELDEIQSRLDFAERLLGQMKARDALPPGPR